MGLSPEYCMLVLYGQRLSPDRATAHLGVRPSAAVRAGDIFKSKITGAVSCPRKVGCWIAQSNDYVSSFILDEHLKWLQNTCTPALLRGVDDVEEICIGVIISCFGDRGEFRLPADFVRYAGELGAYIDVSYECGWKEEDFQPPRGATDSNLE